MDGRRSPRFSPKLIRQLAAWKQCQWTALAGELPSQLCWQLQLTCRLSAGVEGFWHPDHFGTCVRPQHVSPIDAKPRNDLIFVLQSWPLHYQSHRTDLRMFVCCWFRKSPYCSPAPAGEFFLCVARVALLQVGTGLSGINPATCGELVTGAARRARAWRKFQGGWFFDPGSGWRRYLYFKEYCQNTVYFVYCKYIIYK